jgi:predicted ATPase
MVAVSKTVVGVTLYRGFRCLPRSVARFALKPDGSGSRQPSAVEALDPTGGARALPRESIPMELLEREAALVSLNGWLEECRRGRGHVVLVTGEAGAGKTALTQVFCKSVPSSARPLIGACDPIGTPRPLGPLIDIASQLGGALCELVDRGASARELMTAFVDELARRRGRAVVIEDIHWADEGTLDLIRFLARRLNRIPALVVATLRDEGLPAGHPTRVMLGDIAGIDGVRRLPIAPLSPGAVSRLAADSPLDPMELHLQTGGNAFFVTESIAAGVALPETARDAVLARASRLPRRARAVLDAAAVAGSELHPDALVRVADADADADADAVDSCIAARMLEPVGNGLRFRHDVARRAVLEAIAPMRRSDLHRRVLVELESGSAKARLDRAGAPCGGDPGRRCRPAVFAGGGSAGGGAGSASRGG